MNCSVVRSVAPYGNIRLAIAMPSAVDRPNHHRHILLPNEIEIPGCVERQGTRLLATFLETAVQSLLRVVVSR